MLNKRLVIAVFVVVMMVGMSAVALAAGGGLLVMSGTDGYGEGALHLANVDTSDNPVSNCDEILFVWWDAYGHVFDVDHSCVNSSGNTTHHSDWANTDSTTNPLIYPFTLTILDNVYGDICYTSPNSAACEQAFRNRDFTCVVESYYVSPDRGLDDYGSWITPLPLAAEPFRFCGESGGYDGPMITDNRNNSYDLAAPMAIYCPSGLPHFYGINPDGSGYFIFNVSQEEIDAVGIPEVNTIIKERWGFQLWRLTTGEYQGVSPRGPEGKIYNVIYNICLPNAETKSWFAT